MSSDFGFSRGLPIDRYYIERFLGEHAHLIRGRVLEVGDDTYTRRFGGDRVVSGGVVSIRDDPGVDFVGDLAGSNDLPSDTFDCVILTQTLHLIYEVPVALSTLYRCLRPGGTLLLTVPGVSRVDGGSWKESWYWSFTSAAMQRLLNDSFGPDTSVVESHGNVLGASAFLYGLASGEVPSDLLDEVDENFPVTVTAIVTKRPMDI